MSRISISPKDVRFFQAVARSVFFSLLPFRPDTLLEETFNDAFESAITKVLKLDFAKEKDQNYNKRIEMASDYIKNASVIMNDLQTELEKNQYELVKMKEEVERAKLDAIEWSQLAQSEKQVAGAYISKMRDEMRKELDKGKNIRTIGSLLGWLITILIGALAGAYIQSRWDIIQAYLHLP